MQKFWQKPITFVPAPSPIIMLRLIFKLTEATLIAFKKEIRLEMSLAHSPLLMLIAAIPTRTVWVVPQPVRMTVLNLNFGGYAEANAVSIMKTPSMQIPANSWKCVFRPMTEKEDSLIKSFLTVTNLLGSYSLSVTQTSFDEFHCSFHS